MPRLSRSWSRTAAAAAAGSLVVAGAAALPGVAATDAPAPTAAAARAPDRLTQIQLLSFNDFHGNLEPPSGSSGRVVVGHSTGADGKVSDVTVDAGGVEYLATTLQQLREGHPQSLTVAAGDLVGASPLLSAAFYDEPTIEALNEVGLDVTSVGNHEFDDGWRELRRLARGGCRPDTPTTDSCAAGEFAGADFPILAANVVNERTGRTILPATWVKRFPSGAKIGFIGMTLEGTPEIVTKAGIEGLRFTDEVQTANRLVPALRRQGVKAIVALVHEGGAPERQTYQGQSVNPTYDYACEKGGSLTPDSPILPIARGLSPEIDLVITGHTHQPYVCDVPDPRGASRLVTSAQAFGRLVTETTLTYDLRRGDIVRGSVEGSNVVVDRAVPDPGLTKLVDRYRTLVAPIANRVIGSVTEAVERQANAAGESELGDLIADAQLADPSVVTGGRAPQIAFMNPGGIRADLDAGEVTYGEAFTVQPFNNFLVSLDLTGAQIHDLLEQQWSGPNAAAVKVLQVSRGFSYAWNPTTKQLVPGSVTLDGAAVADDASTTYRIVTNNFLADGGDGFTAFTTATNRYVGGLDIDAFARYLTQVSPYTPAPLTRIRTPTG